MSQTPPRTDTDRSPYEKPTITVLGPMTKLTGMPKGSVMASAPF